MKSACRNGVKVILAYFASWVVAYTAVSVSRGDGWDFTHFFAYLKLGWQFRGGELPSFIWLLSTILFVPLAAVSLYVSKRSRRTCQ